MNPIRSQYLFAAPISKSCSLDPIKIYSGRDGRLICVDEECHPKLDPIAYQVKHTITLITLFCQKQFNLCGLDGNGRLPSIMINWDEKNAAWMCHAQDGCSTCTQKCGWIFHDTFAVIPEVVAHEFMHGIVHNLTSLNKLQLNCSRNESGALDESIADVFACSFMHWYRETNWKIRGTSRDLTIHTDATQFRETRICNIKTDFGYVHQNSSIPSHAFFVAVSHLGNSLLLRVARIWIQAALQIRKSNESFADFALRTIRIALKTETEQVSNALGDAWVDVGVLEKTEPKDYEDELEAALWSTHIGEDDYLLET